MSKFSSKTRNAVLALMAAATLGACSASGDVDTSGDGVTVDGDVDTSTTVAR